MHVLLWPQFNSSGPSYRHVDGYCKSPMQLACCVVSVALPDDSPILVGDDSPESCRHSFEAIRRERVWLCKTDLKIQAKSRTR